MKLIIPDYIIKSLTLSIQMLLILVCCTLNENQQNSEEDNQILILEKDLENESLEDLRLMRNSIFAGKGYIFRSIDLKEYFEKQDWYVPRYTNVDSLLSEIDKQNIQTLLALEEKLKSIPTETGFQTTNSNFSKYLSLIPVLELPYTTGCDYEYLPAPQIDDTLKAQFNNGLWEWPYRRIIADKEFAMVLNLGAADRPLPIIKTYDANGDTISTQQMFYDYCGGEPGYFHLEYITIQPDLVINHLDSTWTYDMDSAYNEIEGSKNLKVEKFHYRITDSGEILKEVL